MGSAMSRLDSGAVLARAKAHPSFLLAARYWTAQVAFEIGEERYVLEIADGVPTSFAAVASSTGDCAVRVIATREAWDALMQPVPPPHAHRISATAPADIAAELMHGSAARVVGDLIGDVTPYFAAVDEFVALLREMVNGSVPVRAVADVERAFDTAVGRYMYVRIDGVQYRIYFEEAGTGEIPMVLQHTAGADGRQWRHVLEDPDYQKLYRMIAYDLPYHGKSLPPTGVAWWESEYRLTRDFLMKVVVAVSHALELDRPVFMGCSIGGHLAPDLALYYPEEFRAVIGINGGLGSQTRRSTATTESYYHPRVGNVWKAATMMGQTAPTSPHAYRRETTWIYGQGAPPALKGDVYYYSIDHDLTAEQAQKIDTEKVGVYLLTGEYDFLSAGGSEALARNIPGSVYKMLPGLGHFGPSENPEDFKPVLLPVLEEIARTR